MASMKFLGAVALVVLGATGCASKPAAPFDGLAQSNLMAFRLQNYEPPPPPPGAAPTAAAPGMIPGLPPEIQAFAQQALPGLQQFLPPGLLPPGLLTPGAAAPPPPAVTRQVARFPASTTPNFPILSQTTVMDAELKEELAALLGNEDSYDNTGSSCLYAEMGLAWQSAPGALYNEVLISFSCRQIQGRGFSWPFPATGITPDTMQELSALVQRVFPPGT